MWPPSNLILLAEKRYSFMVCCWFFPFFCTLECAHTSDLCCNAYVFLSLNTHVRGTLWQCCSERWQKTLYETWRSAYIFFSPHILAIVKTHTPFPCMPCPECAPAAFAHTLLLSPLTHSTYKESSHLNGFTLTCLGTHIMFFGTCSLFIHCHICKCMFV